MVFAQRLVTDTETDIEATSAEVTGGNLASRWGVDVTA